jgi:hypothetical protein
MSTYAQKQLVNHLYEHIYMLSYEPLSSLRGAKIQFGHVDIHIKQYAKHVYKHMQLTDDSEHKHSLCSVVIAARKKHQVNVPRSQ